MTEISPPTRTYHIGAHGYSSDKLPAGLYLVPTPIGNLGDVTIRALQTLCAADFIYCEDTRVTVRLLERYGIKGRLKSYHDHNGEIAGRAIMADIQTGHAIVLCSDAGTPLISDPGFPLVRDCLAKGLKVEALPGASAVLPALQLAGFPTDRFTFLGFLPQKRAERLKALSAIDQRPETSVVYESPHRIVDTLTDMQCVMPTRPLSVSREITKLHEETLRGTAQDIVCVLVAKPSVRGEFVIVIGAQEKPKEVVSEQTIDTTIMEILIDNTAGKTASLVSKQFNLPRDEVYARILVLKGKT